MNIKIPNKYLKFLKKTIIEPFDSYNLIEHMVNIPQELITLIEEKDLTQDEFTNAGTLFYDTVNSSLTPIEKEHRILFLEIIIDHYTLFIDAGENIMSSENESQESPENEPNIFEINEEVIKSSMLHFLNGCLYDLKPEYFNTSSPSIDCPDPTKCPDCPEVGISNILYWIIFAFVVVICSLISYKIGKSPK